MPRPRLDLLEQQVSFYPRLPPQLQTQLQEDVCVFLDEKKFSGQQGLIVTDTMRVIVAAWACLLQLNLATRYFPGFTTIIMYPNAYRASHSSSDGVVHSQHEQIRAGEKIGRAHV